MEWMHANFQTNPTNRFEITRANVLVYILYRLQCINYMYAVLNCETWTHHKRNSFFFKKQTLAAQSEISQSAVYIVRIKPFEKST